MDFLKFIRWKEWGPDKITYFFTFFFYIALTDRLFSYSFLIDFLVGVVFISSLAVFGYLSNDLGDRELDRAQGKYNSLMRAGPLGVILIFVGIILIMILSGIRFMAQSWFPVLWVLQVILSAAYSLPPLRLKGRGVSGLVANILAQYTIPTALIFAFFGDFGRIDMAGITFCATITGGAMEIGHQRYHLAADRETGIRTFAVRVGSSSISRLYRVFLLLDKISIAVLIACLLAGIPRIIIPGLILPIPPASPLVIIYLFLLWKSSNSASPEFNDPYNYRGPKNAANILHAIFPSLIIPMYLSFLLVCYNISNLLILLFFLLWISPGLSREKLRDIVTVMIRRRNS